MDGGKDWMEGECKDQGKVIKKRVQRKKLFCWPDLIEFWHRCVY